MRPLQRIGAAELRRVMLRYRDVLRGHQQELNDLNVYPVPDGDSGTNMRLTMDAVATQLHDAGDMIAVCRAISRGAQRGARGNSGVILSQILHGMAKVLAGGDAVGGSDLAAALRKGCEIAYDAVHDPKEGTILTVVRAAADHAGAAAERGAGLAEVLERALAGAEEALRETRDMLPELRRAGVVDAGGKGLTLLLEAFLAEVEGRPVHEPEPSTRSHAPGQDEDRGSPRYEVMFFLEADDFAIARFRKEWATLGDSIIVAGEEGHYNCHIHTDDIGRAIEAGIEAGRPSAIRVTDLERHGHAAIERRRSGGPSARAAGCALVVVADGEGTRSLLEGLGAVAALDPEGADADALASYLADLGARGAVVLTAGEPAAEAARDAASRVDVDVAVVPACGEAEALAAAVFFDPGLTPDANAAAMSEGAARVKVGRVRGDAGSGYVAVNRHGQIARAATLQEAARRLLDHLVSEGDEVVTVLEGRGADEQVTAALRAHLEDAHPHVVTEVHSGGQKDPYVFGVE